MKNRFFYLLLAALMIIGLACNRNPVKSPDCPECEPLSVTAGANPNPITVGQSSTLTATVTGGKAPFVYSWSNGATTVTASVSPSVTTDYTVTVTDAENTSKSTTVKLTVNPATPTLSVTPDTLKFGATDTEKKFVITKKGAGTLTWSLTDSVNWLTPTPVSGTDSGTVLVKVNRAGLSAGNYLGKIYINSNGGGKVVVVTMTVNQPTPTTLTITSVPSDADVKLDGTSIGKTPVNKYVTTAGAHTIEVAKTGYNTKSVNVTVTANQDNAVEVKLEVVTMNIITLYEAVSGSLGIGAGDCTYSGNIEVQIAFWMLSGGSLTGMTPYITVSCAPGQRWYLLVYRSANVSEKIWFTGPGEHKICDALPANFLGLYIGVETGCVRAQKVVAKGTTVPGMARVERLNLNPLNRPAGTEN